ncbi:hypothetical protein HK405_000407, partial [Cladochytrium tenue]
MSTVANYINGNPVATNGSGSAPIDVVDPASGAVIATVLDASEADINSAVDSARAALASWSQRTVKDRAQVMIRFHQLVIKHQEELIDLIVREHGKTRSEALGEISKGNETVEYAISLPQLVQGKILDVSRGVTCRDMRLPVGVVATIVPFNFPFMVPMWTIPISITLGNTVVLKPSEKVPLTMTRVAALLAEAGLPAGVLNLVQGGASVAKRLASHPLVDAVTFVGSSPVAEFVERTARSAGKRVLALGGAKNHLVAYPDCDVEMASTDIVNSFTGCAGQRCMAASVLLLIGPQPALLKRIVEKAAALTPGQSGAAAMGPVIDAAAQERISRYVAEAAGRDGADVLLDGRSWSSAAATPKGGFWVGPTVLLHRSRADRALHDEIFGPLLSVMQVASKEEAIDIENTNPYGNA